MALLAKLGDRVALCRQAPAGAVVRSLASAIACWIRSTSSAAAFASQVAASAATFRLEPARVKQPSLDSADLVAQLAIALGGPSLAPKLRRALLLFRQDFAKPGQVGFGGA